MPALLDTAAIVAGIAALAGAGLGIAFLVRGGAWTPPRPAILAHALLGLGAVALTIAVVAVGPPTRTEPEGGISFGVLAMAFLIVAAAIGAAGHKVSTSQPGVRGFVLSAHALFAVFGSALAIAAAVTASN
ncbi:hypothetical protein SAMN05216241_10431 [Limimonas halophila]|uniref:Uncharacterized protein n=1 Tax=Limimonas halophila TaxID=1082479 RepID=A0A1G7QJ58_9PROT|nr:hypothetical protein [Limimonas halophila]SDF98597.1 hypothetical protein SAMN05216241_10431 [Limimonas halophila]